MHPELAFGTCRVIYQKQDAECFRQPRNFCTPFRAFPGAAATSTGTAKLLVRKRTREIFSLSWDARSAIAQNRPSLRISGFFGVSTIINLNFASYGLMGYELLHGCAFPAYWQCSSKNVSSRKLGEPKESVGFGVRAEKSKRVTRDQKPLVRNVAPVKSIERKTCVPEQRSNAENNGRSMEAASKESEDASTAKQSDARATKNTERKQARNTANAAESTLKEKSRAHQNTSSDTDGFVTATVMDESGMHCDASLAADEDSFGRTLLCSGSARERRNILKKLRLGQEIPDTEDLNDVLTSLCRQRRSAEAHELMDAVKFMPPSARHSLMHNVKTYTIMIDICGKSRQLPKAFSLFYGMQREGLVPNVITYNAMVAACSRNNEPDLAFEVFKEMQEAGLTPDKFTYGALIDSCAKCGKVDRAFEIADLMERKKIQKDQTIYSALMDACGRAKQVDRAFSVYEDMKRCGVWPNLITFSVLIDTCANAREPEKAFQLFSEVKHWGFPHANVVVYTALIDACAKAGWHDEAKLVMEAMIRDNVQPNEITYGALIDGWSRAGRLDEAFASLGEMTYQHRVAPNAVLLGGIAETARRLREYKRAKQLWEIMVQHNIRISRVFYPALMVMAAHNGDVDVAIGIAFHVFGSGHLRRCGTRSDDPCSRALADALIFVRSKINSCKDAETRAVRQARMKALYDSTGMSLAEMDSVNPSNAFYRCISWGDFDQHRPNNSFKRRADRVGNSKAKQARDAGLRSLQESRRSQEETHG